MGRRLRFWSIALVGALLAWAVPSEADSVAVPPFMQAQIAGKLLAFDRALEGRTGPVVHILVLTARGEGQSRRIANEFAAAMRSLPNVAGRQQAVVVAAFDGGAALAERVRRERIAAVYLSSGLVESTEDIAASLRGVDVMTIAAEPVAVPRGITVGFDLVSGSPKMLVNLPQAKVQNVQLPASVLRLAVISGG